MNAIEEVFDQQEEVRIRSGRQPEGPVGIQQPQLLQIDEVRNHVTRRRNKQGHENEEIDDAVIGNPDTGNAECRQAQYQNCNQQIAAKNKQRILQKHRQIDVFPPLREVIPMPFRREKRGGNVLIS